MALLDALLGVTLVALVASLIWLERSRLKPQPAAATAANGSGSERDPRFGQIGIGDDDVDFQLSGGIKRPCGRFHRLR